MTLTAKTIAEHLNGTIEGNPDTQVAGFARIEQAKEGELCFLANPKYEDWLYKTKASIAIVNKTFTLKQPVSLTVIWVDDAYQGIASMLDLYAALNSVNKTGRERPSHVSWWAKVGKRCYIGRYAYISKGAKVGSDTKIFPQVFIGENVTIGDNCILYPGVKVYAGCHIGHNCIIHAGAVIGADGFGFAPDADKNYKKIPQVGNVIIEDDVEIGANATIDRATMNSTIVRKGVKIDNLVHLAHNVEVGSNTVMAAQGGVAGSTKIGQRCMIGGQVGLANHLHIGNDSQIAAQSGIMTDVPEKSVLLGSPALPHLKFTKAYVVFRELPELRKQVAQLQKELEALKGKA